MKSKLLYAFIDFIQLYSMLGIDMHVIKVNKINNIKY